MTANDIEPVNNMRRVSSGNRATERNDSIQEKPKPSSSAKPRRPSLIEAMRRASLVIGDGVCESWKELRMLGILPEPETEDDDAGPGADVNATDLAREENTRESVDATDSVRSQTLLVDLFASAPILMHYARTVTRAYAPSSDLLSVISQQRYIPTRTLVIQLRTDFVSAPGTTDPPRIAWKILLRQPHRPSSRLRTLSP